MRKPNRFEPRKNKKQQKDVWEPIVLPTESFLVIYARRSDPTAIKKLNTSNEMQTSDLTAYAMQLGWPEERIILIDLDMGVSGAKRIDEREGMKYLFELVQNDKVKAVLIQMEDRLFRDDTRIQYSTFIQLCKLHNVLVITPHMIYDLNNRFHEKQFVSRLESAADYLKDYVQARLVEGKHKVGRRGDYTGGGTPPGFLVDTREHIFIDGLKVKNPSYRKYSVYEPHATIVLWLFDRYMMVNGNLNALCIELRAMPVVFPDVPPEILLDATISIQLRKVPGGYHITRRGVISILTNVAYLGWWVYQGEVMSKSNHPAIVSEDVFWYAFNRLASFTIDGKQNEVKSHPARYHQTRAEESQALLKGIITTEYLGSVYVVPANQRTSWYYALHEKDLSLQVQYHSAISVPFLDSVFVKKLLEHLRTTSDFTHYREYVNTVKKDFDRETISIKEQLVEIEKQSKGIEATLKVPTIKEKTRIKFLADYELLQEQKDLLEAKLTQPSRNKRVKTLLDYYDLIDRIAELWEKNPFEIKRALAEGLAEEVLIDELSPHWMRFIIKWRIAHWGSDHALIWRVEGVGGKWTEEENTILLQHYPTDDRHSILERLPHRSWHAITFQANQLKLKRSTQMKNNSSVPSFITLLDFQFMQEKGIVYDANWQRKEVIWLESEQVEGIGSFWNQLSERRRQ